MNFENFLYWVPLQIIFFWSNSSSIDMNPTYFDGISVGNESQTYFPFQRSVCCNNYGNFSLNYYQLLNIPKISLIEQFYQNYFQLHKVPLAQPKIGITLWSFSQIYYQLPGAT